MFLSSTLAVFLVPLLATLGTPVLWVLLPFILASIALVWHYLHRSYAERELFEDLKLGTKRAQLVRHDPDGREKRWQADIHLIRADLHASAGPVANYVRLTGAGRTVEIGAFLGPEERLVLFRGLSDRLRQNDGKGE